MQEKTLLIQVHVCYNVIGRVVRIANITSYSLEKCFFSTILCLAGADETLRFRGTPTEKQLLA